MTKETRPYGHFVLDHGLPENDYYSFTDGEISVTVERGGGLNDVGCLDILDWEGKRYPDRSETPIVFRKRGRQCGKRPCYGPAVQFISTHTLSDGRPGRNVFHVPDRLELYPFGFRSESFRFGSRTAYDMAIDGRSILFAFANEFPNRRELVTCVDKNHIVQGPAGTLKNQLADFLGTLAEGFPFRDDRSFEQRWDSIGLDAARNAFVMEGVMRFPYGARDAVVMIAADRDLALTDTKYRYLLSAPWGRGRSLRMALVVAASRDEARARADAALKGCKGVFARKVRQAADYSRRATQLDSRAHPEVGVFGRTAPSFLRSMVLAETEREACIRAATQHYGFFDGWDQIWPARALVLMGDWPLARKLVRYHASFPMRQMERLAQVACHLITTIEDIVAVSGDRGFLDEMYPRLKALFGATNVQANRRGLIPGLGFSVDDPKEVEQLGQVLCPDLNGWWYGACRALENMALLLDDGDTAAQAGETARRIEQSFLDTFYDCDKGYLYIAVSAETGQGIPVYHNVMTLGMDYPYGEYLLHARMRALAEFQAYQLCHPAGRSAVAYWDRADEMWHSCIMFQHIAHEMRIARAAGMGDEIDRMMKVYLELFSTFKTARETHNIVGCDADAGQRADWQAFGTRALYSGIVEGLMGIQCDLGGFHYTPCDTPGEMSLRGFRFRRGRWDITVRGKGARVRRFLIDGRPVAGTLKVPAEFLRDARTHTLVVERGAAPSRAPMLLSAAGASVCGVSVSSAGVLSFSVDQPVHANCKLACSAEPRVACGGKAVEVRWDPASGTAWADVRLQPGVKVIVEPALVSAAGLRLASRKGGKL